MKLNELRIGNLVNYEQTTHVVTGITGISVHSKWYKAPDEEDYVDYIENYKPIPLTRELLYAAGFQEVPHFTVLKSLVLPYKKNQFSIGGLGTANETMFYKEDNDVVTIHNYDYHGILHLHQLQNIYYAITRTELEFTGDLHN